VRATGYSEVMVVNERDAAELARLTATVKADPTAQAREARDRMLLRMYADGARPAELVGIAKIDRVHLHRVLREARAKYGDRGDRPS
jgi:site-specific recombinase XerD